MTQRFFFRRATSAMASLAIATGVIGAPSLAAQESVSLLDSVPIGSNGMCEAQIQPPKAGDYLFDRHYQIVCKDAAAPIGKLQVTGLDLASAVLALESQNGAICEAGKPADVAQLGNARRTDCITADGLRRTIITGEWSGQYYAASGVAIYDDALRLGLTTLAGDELVEGEINIPLTEASDASAFARAQAEAISAQAALAEGYRRANAGNFAEAAEFFEATAADVEGDNALEAQMNAALQQSNLGNYRAAAVAFSDSREALGDRPVLARMLRNFEALDALNTAQYAAAIDILDAPLPGNSASLDALRALEITTSLARRLSEEQGNAISGATGQLTPLERAQLLDAQAQYIRAVALRSQGQLGPAGESLQLAQDELIAVRDGRIASVLWLRAQVLSDMGELAELNRDTSLAELRHAEAIALLETNYPASPALVTARAQLAGYLARAGREDEALALYRLLVEDADSKPAATLRRLLAPYFAMLARRSDTPEAAAEMFNASQLLLRPGLAQTQAVLARELSGGSDEAGQLFRQSVNIGRVIERTRAEIAQAELALESEPDPTQEALAALDASRATLASLRARQLTLQQSLAQYPRYRAVSDKKMALGELAAVLQPGEAYYKLVMLDEEAYAIFATPSSTRAFQIDGAPSDIEFLVDTLRDSIAIEQSGQTITYPFEIALARELYTNLFGPIDSELRQTTHLVFEPDGAMLRLPANLLVMDDASVSRYLGRTANPEADPYDFRGTAWLGRAMEVTTAVSPTSFRDVRAARRSDAMAAYLGLGQNAPVGNESVFALSRVRSGGTMGDDCRWQSSAWNNPIQDDELRTAANILNRGGNQSTLLTGAEFTDSMLKQRQDLDEYRILHFATHGLVTAPEPGCPPRPALLTSFGDQDSDGLLTFAEIFDLQLDADLVILSACNTASVGGLVATREAGISTGGDFALDGLVRAFVGAGGRTVVASHWPVPDDYGATNRLMSGFFSASQGVHTAEALRSAQLGLMDDADTSHPFYWSAFAVVGDGTIPVRP